MEQRESHVPYIAHEAALARMERANRRLVWIVVILIVALIASNLAWTIYESQFETVVTTQEVTQEAEDGVNHFIGGDYYGEADRQNNYQKTNP